MAKHFEPLASGNVSTGLCNSPDMYFGVSKYLPIFLIRQNVAERSSSLRECLGKPLLGTPRGGLTPSGKGRSHPGLHGHCERQMEMFLEICFIWMSLLSRDPGSTSMVPTPQRNPAPDFSLSPKEPSLQVKERLGDWCHESNSQTWVLL